MAEHRRIYAYYRGLLKHWERDLNARPDEAKRTLQVGGGGLIWVGCWSWGWWVGECRGGCVWVGGCLCFGWVVVGRGFVLGWGEEAQRWFTRVWVLDTRLFLTTTGNNAHTTGQDGDQDAEAVQGLHPPALQALQGQAGGWVGGWVRVVFTFTPLHTHITFLAYPSHHPSSIINHQTDPRRHPVEHRGDGGVLRAGRVRQGKSRPFFQALDSGSGCTHTHIHTHTSTCSKNTQRTPQKPQTHTRQAHEVYLRTAIGNAPWPIGLTMVGIHERTGREKISSSKVS